MHHGHFNSIPPHSMPKKIMISRPKVLVDKGVARTGFEVTFKPLGLAQGFEGNIEPEFPGFETSRVPAFSRIMFLRRLLRSDVWPMYRSPGFC